MLWKAKSAVDMRPVIKSLTREETINRLDRHMSVLESRSIKYDGWEFGELRKFFKAAKEGRLQDLKYYVKSDIPIDCIPCGSQTPCYISAYYGHVDCLEYLLENGANANKVDKKGFRPAHAAASKGNVKCLQVLHKYGADL